MISSLRSGTICYHFTTLSFCFHFSIQSLPSISTTTTRAPAIHPLPGPLYRCLHEPPGFCSVPLMIHFLHSSEWDPLKLQIWCAWHPNKVRLLSAHLTTFPLTLPLTSWVLLSLIRPKLLKKITSFCAIVCIIAQHVFTSFLLQLWVEFIALAHNFELGHMTHFGQLDISRCDMSKSLRYDRVVGLHSSLLPWPWEQLALGNLLVPEEGELSGADLNWTGLAWSQALPGSARPRLNHGCKSKI